MRGLYPERFLIEDIRRHTYGLADLVNGADLTTPVPTCGDWTLADLAFHLYEVQRFWNHVLAGRPGAGPETYDRPEDLESGHAAALRDTADELVGLLADADPADPAWSWSEDHTVGFTIRRQIHEAIIHHIDGVVATGAALPSVEPELAADGLDELADVMLTGIPTWATFVPAIQVVRVEATDTDDRWTMSLGSVSGTSDQTGMTYDGLLAADRIGDDVAADLTIGGNALDVLLWLWGRAGADRLQFDGDAAIADALRATVVSATQ